MAKTPKPNTEAHSAVTVASGQVTLAAIVGRLSELDQQRNAIVAEIVRLERSGRRRGPVPEARSAAREIDRAARAALNGEAVALPAIDAEPADDLRILDRRLLIIDRAVALGREIETTARHREAAARVAEHADAWTAAMRDVVAAVLALEQSLQRRDQLARKIAAPGFTLPGLGWAFLGRLRDRAGPAYNFLNESVRHGWLTLQRLEEEVRRARESAKS